jgi:hypothetical protein
MSVCIGIVCIGQKYIKEFETTFKPSVEQYAKKYGYDLKIFTDFLDSKHTHPDCISFQKCLVPSLLKDYECVIVMDADIYVHDYTPPIHELLTDKIGIVNEVAQISGEQYLALGFASEPMQYYKLAGFHLNTNKILNTGVMICNPNIHSKFLEDVYDKHISKAQNHPRRFHYEQACIGYELQAQNMYSLLENRWNYIYIFNKFLNIPFAYAYFIHFAGMGGTRAIELARYLAAHRSKSLVRWGVQK